MARAKSNQPDPAHAVCACWYMADAIRVRVDRADPTAVQRRRRAVERYVGGWQREQRAVRPGVDVERVEAMPKRI